MGYVGWSIVIIYLVGITLKGIQLGRETSTLRDYFVGDRNFKWRSIGLSIVATQVSAVSLVGAPGWAYNSGLTPIVLNLNIPLVMWFLAGTLIPIFYNCRVTSVYEYLGKRFGNNIRSLMAVVYILKMMMIVGVLVYAPSLILAQITGLSINLTILLITVIAIFYTVLGGIKAVIWTDVVQMLMLWGGVIVSFAVLVINLPNGFTDAVLQASELGKLQALDFSGGFKLPNTFWAGIVGGTMLHLAYFGVDQSQVQRMITAKSTKHLKYALWMSSIIAVAQMIIFLFMGTLLYVYFEGMPFENPNQIFLEFVLDKVPSVVLGVIVAAIFAASMSSIDSALNSMSTIYITDIHHRVFGSDVSEQRKILTTRISTVVFGLGVVGFAYLVSNSNLPLLEAISKYGSYLLGGMLGVFILGMFSWKANETGAVCGLLAGVAGVAYIELAYGVFWMWHNFFGLVICLVVGYIVSLATGSETKKIDLFVIQGQKALFKGNGLKATQDGVYIMPGKFERNSYWILVYFVIVTLLLALL